ncbi:AsmA-like C-terminal region-containing protein [Nibricoccus sp. IMCC34717]|uniref:AsmA-like C-terminal region-containing protein n=1 Tax=Nibricoccus sp. IMCC34717 TaxID=3034021 RepID=UPI00384FCAEB
MARSDPAKAFAAALQLAGGVVRAAGNWVLWFVWLILVLVLAFQLHVAFTHEIRLPEAAARRIELRLRERGWEASFETAKLDPQGHVAVQALRLRRTGGAGPAFYCERADIEVNPWLALAGFVEPSRLQLSNARVELPPLLSPTGTEFTLVNRIEAVFTRQGANWNCDGLHGWLGPVELTLTGPVPLPKRSTGLAKNTPAEQPNYSRALRVAAGWLARSDLCSAPRLEVRLLEADAGSLAEVNFFAESATVPLDEFAPQLKAGTLHLQRLQLSLDVPRSLTPPATLHLSAHRVTQADRRLDRLAADLTVHSFSPGAKASAVDASLRLAAWGLYAERLEFPYARFDADWRNGELSLTAVTQLWTEPISLTLRGDPIARSGEASLRTQITQAVLDGAGAYVNRPFGALLRPAGPAPFEASAVIGAGGRLSSARAWLSSGPVLVRGVSLDAAASEITLEGQRVLCDRLYLKTGDSQVRGSYEMDTKDLFYRFRLAGTLYPPAISGWFHSWWPRFWKSFTLDELPAADTDILGRWGDPADTRLFISVDARRPHIRAAEFDRVQTSLFIRPHFFDGISAVAEKDGRRAIAQFTRLLDLNANSLVEQRIQADANLPFATYQGLFGRDADEVLSPFTAEEPPQLKLAGTIRGPASPQGPGRDLTVAIRAPSRFTLYRFPLSDLKCDATLHDDDLHVRDLAVGFAGGRVTGEFSLAGKNPTRTLKLDANLAGARLGEAIQILDEFGIQRKGGQREPGKISRFQSENADGILDGFVKTTGIQGDPHSFTGVGQTSITRAKLAEINLLGQLSQALRSVPLLNFTSFSLTAATADFELARDKLLLPKLRITGPSAEIMARGDYSLRDKTMHVGATIFPFSESKNPLATTMGFVLSPLSAVLELKLEGTLEHPKWHFTRGPTELFRRLLPEEKEKSGESPTAPAQPPALLRRH